MTMIILDILNVLSEECIYNDALNCSKLLEFPSSQYGLLIDFIAKSVPGMAFMYVNRPKDFMIDYNKYPDNITHVSIIQYHNHCKYYQSQEQQEAVVRSQTHHMSKVFGINLLKG